MVKNIKSIMKTGVIIAKAIIKYLTKLISPPKKPWWYPIIHALASRMKDAIRPVTTNISTLKTTICNGLLKYGFINLCYYITKKKRLILHQSRCFIVPLLELLMLSVGLLLYVGIKVQPANTGTINNENNSDRCLLCIQYISTHLLSFIF